MLFRSPQAPVSAPVVQEPVAVAPAVQPLVAPPVTPAPAMSPVPAPSIFPPTLTRRDEVIIEQRRTAEIPVLQTPSPVEEPEPVETEVVVVEEVAVETVEAELEYVEENFDDEDEPVTEVVPIDLEPVEIEAVRIDQREDREEITNEFEPFTITTTSTGVIPTTSHALVLPTLPEEDPSLIAALNSTGEIVITGQITLPVGIAQNGAETASIDTSDIDLIIDDDEVGSGQDLAPVSASQAISSFTGTAINVTVPKRTSEKLPVILAISAAVLALGVVGLFVANYFLRVF